MKAKEVLKEVVEITRDAALYSFYICTFTSLAPAIVLLSLGVMGDG